MWLFLLLASAVATNVTYINLGVVLPYYDVSGNYTDADTAMGLSYSRSGKLHTSAASVIN